MSLSLFGSHKANVRPVVKRRGAEAIDMRSRRFGYFPRTFVWRGREFQVEAVERCWTTASRRNGGQMDRHYFQVRCAEGTYNVFQDLRHNTWHIAAQVVTGDRIAQAATALSIDRLDRIVLSWGTAAVRELVSTRTAVDDQEDHQPLFFLR